MAVIKGKLTHTTFQFTAELTIKAFYAIPKVHTPGQAASLSLPLLLYPVANAYTGTDKVAILLTAYLNVSPYLFIKLM